ncbi:MAG: hypothetical protein IJ589_11070 [Lachnospiraceae bacterium]|nr:hypothetical protein [Lachnospiraceae bacterium]
MKKITIVRTIILCVAAAFMAAGIGNGEFQDVWMKAIMICRECIGLG